MSAKSLWDEHPILSLHQHQSPSRFSTWDHFHLPLLGLLAGFFLIGLLNHFFVRLYKINGDSNALFPDSKYVIAEMGSYLFRYPKPEEVVVFNAQKKEFVGKIVDGSAADGFTIVGTQEETWHIAAADIYARVYFPKSKVRQVLSVTSEPTPEPSLPLSSPTPVVISPTPKTPVSPTPAQWYLLSLRPTKEPIKLTGSLAAFVTEQIAPEAPGQFAIQKIVYDVRLGSPFNNDGLDRLNFDYFLKIAGSPLDNITVDTGDITLNLTLADPGLIPFLEDQKYCLVSSDCNQRQSHCSVGSYNRYQPYLDVWACRWYEDQEGEQTQWYDSDRQCTQTVEYQQHLCQDNQCVAGQKTTYCQSDN